MNRSDLHAPAGRVLVCRFLAAAFFAFALLNEAREALSPGFSAADILLYIPGRRAGSDVCVALTGALLFVSAFGPVRRRRVVLALAAALLGFAAVAALNAAQFYALVRSGRLSSAWPVPLSAVIAVYLVLHVTLCLVPRHRVARSGGAPAQEGPAAAPRRFFPRGTIRAAITAACALTFGVAFYVHALGLTDYRRPADVIVVLGARVYADGRPSEALRERVETAAALYRQGLSRRIIVSGGIGDSGHSEPRVMRAVLLAEGVPDEAIIEDEQGENTEATVLSVRAIAERDGLRSVLSVSHYHHLPRIKMLCARSGLRCFTVPADEGATRLRKTPYYVVREMAALAWVYLKG